MRINARARKVAFMMCYERPLLHELFEGKAARNPLMVGVTSRVDIGEWKSPITQKRCEDKQDKREGKNTVTYDLTSRKVLRAER